jgi:hypothetical protein
MGSPPVDFIMAQSEGGLVARVINFLRYLFGFELPLSGCNNRTKFPTKIFGFQCSKQHGFGDLNGKFPCLFLWLQEQLIERT